MACRLNGSANNHRWRSIKSSFLVCCSSGIASSSQEETNKLLAALKACSCLRDVILGKKIHGDAVESGCHSNIYVSTTVVDMYAKCGSLWEARSAFEAISEIHQINVVGWSVLILGYADNGEAEAGLDLFARMQTQGCVPNCRAFVAALKSCTKLAKKELLLGGKKLVERESLVRGREIHNEAAANSCDGDLYVSTSLIDMYAKCGRMEEAWCVFVRMPCHNVVSWNALLLGYAENGEGDRCLSLFDCIPEPNARTLVAALKACSSSAGFNLGKARSFHCLAVKIGCHTDVFISNTLVDVYAKCGGLAEARAVFEGMQYHTVVSWNSLMLGYVGKGRGEAALEMFASMDCEPDSTSFVAAVKACSCGNDLEAGKAVHALVCRRGCEGVTVVATALIDLYAKCGRMVEARRVFDSVDIEASKSGVSWSALIAGHSREGDTRSVFGLFREMREEGVVVDGITLVSVMSACSHGGLVDRGKELFDAMESRYGVSRGIEHYHCLIDLFGRADNSLDEALRVLRSMPFTPNAVSWTILLAACAKWKNMEMAKVAFESLLQIDEFHVVAYKLMANACGQ